MNGEYIIYREAVVACSRNCPNIWLESWRETSV